MAELSTVVGQLGVVTLDHTAIAVRDLQAALRLYRDLLGGVPSQHHDEPERGFRWLALEFPNGSSSIELLEPLPGTPGFLHRFLEKYGEGVHHVTFHVADVRIAVERARAAGLRVVDENYADLEWQEAFISPGSAFGTIVQLAHTPHSLEERRQRWSAHRFLV